MKRSVSEEVNIFLYSLSTMTAVLFMQNTSLLSGLTRCGVDHNFRAPATIFTDTQFERKDVIEQESHDVASKGTARCRSCCFRFKVRRQHSLQIQEKPSFESQASELQTYRRKTEWKGNKGLSNSLLNTNVGLIC